MMKDRSMKGNDMQTDPGPSASKPIHVRVKPDLRALIDQAATLAGKTRTEFILDASRTAAVNALLDRSLIEVDEAAYGRFLQALDEPPKVLPGMRRLLDVRAPWESEADL